MHSVIIRDVKTEDIPQIATTHVQSWQTTYTGQLPQSYLYGLSIPKRERAWTEALQMPQHKMLVAEDGGIVVGFSSFGPSRDDDSKPNGGELYAIYVKEEYKRRGIGKSLWEETLKALNERGYAEITLWVLDANRRARDFYEKVGFVADGKTKTENIGGKEVVELRYRMMLDD